jgi:DNA anti-recombination protein RmuC
MNPAPPLPPPPVRPPAPPRPPPPPPTPPRAPLRAQNNKMPNNTGGKYNKKSRDLYTKIKNLIQSLSSPATITQQTVNNAKTQVRTMSEQINQIQKEFVADVNAIYNKANQRLNKKNVNIKFNVHKSCITSKSCPRIREMDKVLAELQKFLNNQVAMLNQVAASNVKKNTKNIQVMNQQKTATQRIQLNRNTQNLIRELRNIQQKI